MVSIGARFLKIREAGDLRQEDLGSLLGITRQMVSRYEQGLTTKARAGLLGKLADAERHYNIKISSNGKDELSVLRAQIAELTLKVQRLTNQKIQ